MYFDNSVFILFLSMNINIIIGLLCSHNLDELGMILVHYCTSNLLLSPQAPPSLSMLHAEKLGGA